MISKKPKLPLKWIGEKPPVLSVPVSVFFAFFAVKFLALA